MLNMDLLGKPFQQIQEIPVSKVEYLMYKLIRRFIMNKNDESGFLK